MKVELEVEEVEEGGVGSLVVGSREVVESPHLLHLPAHVLHKPDGHLIST